MTMKGRFILDETHSAILFRIKHLGITTITGCFKEFSGEASFETADFSGASISFEAQTQSICTRHEERDEHLRSVDFFHASAFPTFNFHSSSFKLLTNNQYKPVSYTHLRAHETLSDLVCRLLLEKTTQRSPTAAR